MKSLIKNDLRWAWPLALLGTLIQILIQQSEHEVAGLWILPSNDFLEIGLGFFAVAAPVAGLWALFADDLLGGREYLMHRPLSSRRIFWTRHLVGLAVVASWALLTPTLHLLGCWLFSPNAPLVEPGRWGTLAVLAAPAFFLYALTVFLASCARSVIGGLLLAAAGDSVLCTAVWLAVIDGQPPVFAGAVVLGAALTPVLLDLAERNRRLAPDRDRPWRWARLTRSGTALLLVSGVAAALLLTLVQVAARLALLHQYPDVAARDGELILSKWSGRDGHFWQVDDQHRRIQRLAHPPRKVFSPDHDVRRLAPMPATGSGAVYSHASPAVGKLPWGVDRVGGRAYRRLNFGVAWQHVRAFLDEDGRVRVYRLADHDGAGEDQPRTWLLGRGADARPFPDHTVVIETFARETFLGADGELWRLDMVDDAPALVRTPLPDGDRFVAEVRLLYAGNNRILGSPPLLVQGEHGRYLWRNRGFVRADRLDRDALNGFELAETPPAHEVRLRGDIGVDVWFRLDSGPMFAHQYRPHTVPEHILAFVQRGSAALRSPVSTLAAPLAGPDRAVRLGAALLLDRPVLLGDWPALGANLLLTALLAALGFRRLARLGAPRARRLYWAGAILLGGAPAYLCLRLIERPRAWAPMPGEPEGRPAAAAALLLQNA